MTSNDAVTREILNSKAKGSGNKPDPSLRVYLVITTSHKTQTVK